MNRLFPPEFSNPLFPAYDSKNLLVTAFPESRAVETERKGCVREEAGGKSELKGMAFFLMTLGFLSLGWNEDYIYSINHFYDLS